MRQLVVLELKQAGVLFGLAAATLLAGARDSSPRPARPAQAVPYEKLPLVFAVNLGQTDSRVRFLAHGRGYSVFATAEEIVLALHRREAPAGGGQAVRTAVLRLKLVGGNPDAEIVGVDELPGRASYFIGDDPSRWRADVPTFSRVEYRNVYPGIGLVLYGNERRLAYDFVLAPGAQPSQITLAVEGARKMELDTEGGLVVDVPGGRLRQTAPLVFQENVARRSFVPGGYVSKNGKRFGFRVGAYDRRQRLVIDPTIEYSSYLGGASSDSIAAIAVDGEGNSYVSGHTHSIDFPTANAVQPDFGGGDTRGDAFVAKLNADGSGLAYSTYLGGSDNDEAFGIAVDDGGNAYVTGRTLSVDFPTVNPLQPNLIGFDAFVAKLTPSGSALTYSTYLGGGAEDEARAIAVDGSGRAHVTGFTASSDFPTLNAFQPVFRGGFSEVGDMRGDAFFSALGPAGEALAYSTFLGGGRFEVGYGVATDSGGNAYVAGYTESADFPTLGPIQPIHAGSHDAFVAKFAPSGSAVYSTYLGGLGLDQGRAVAADALGSAYVTGVSSSATFTTAIPLRPPGGGRDAFVAKLSGLGTHVDYLTFLGGNGVDQGLGVDVDAVGAVYLTGETFSKNFPLVNPLQSALSGASDAFVAAIDVTGLMLTFSTYLGGSSFDSGWGIAFEGADRVHVAGFTWSSDFPTADPLQTDQGGLDAFVARIVTGAVPFSTELLGGVLAELDDLLEAHPGTPLADKIEDARASTQSALDKLTRTPSDRQGATGEIEGAVGDLQAAVKARLLARARGNGLMDRLAVAARLLAEAALAEAKAASGKPAALRKAQRALAKGDVLKAAGACRSAVKRYKDALSKAESA